MRRSAHFLLFVVSIILCVCACQRTDAATTQELELLKGFKATPNPSVSSFQALLSDATNNFSLGFLRVNSKELALAVLHVRSSEPVWVANPNPTQLAPWSAHTQLLFNGSLVISGPRGRVFWSTATQGEGDRVVLLNSSNLQIQNLEFHDSPSVLWQSFDFPTDTLIENQNFFASNTSLVSSNGLYSMRLGDNFMGLYAMFNEDSEQIYWRHKAMEAKARVIEGQGPIYARVNSDGFLGMYQLGTTPAVDIQPFNSFQRNITGLRLLRLEADGNLKGYYWDISNSKWVLDYQAISETCELPSPCGSYALCRAASGSACSCLDNRTEHCSGECFASSSNSKGDFCSKAEGEDQYWVLRREGVDLPFKELIRYEMTSNLKQCEDVCGSNCSCWGALYNNASGFCYLLDYPIQTLLGVGGESKMGYFKVRKDRGKKKMDVRFGVLCGTLLILMAVISFGSYRIWIRRRRAKRILEEDDGISPGPYKDLGSASFRSIEMCNNNLR